MNLKFTLLGLLLCCGNVLMGQNEGLKFRNYGIRDGLSQSSILSIYQDDKGFMWFGTSDGLNQFDGYKFKVYKNSYLNNNTLSDNWIQLVFEDHKKNLWVYSIDRTFNRINLKTQEVTRFLKNKYCPPGYTQVNFIINFLEDKRNNIWFSSDAGIFRFNNSSEKFEFFENDPNCPSNLKGNLVFQFFEDSAGRVWFTSLQGLYCYQYSTGKFTRYTHQDSDPNSLLSNKIVRLFTDKNKNLGVLTYAGLSFYQSKSNTFSNYPFNKLVDFEMPGKFNSALVDKKGDIWIGSPVGLYFFSSKTGGYTFYEKSAAKKSLSNNYVTSIYEDYSGNIWVGTANGLNKFNPEANNFDTYFSKSQFLGSNFVITIFEDKNRDILTLSIAGQDRGAVLSYLNQKDAVLEIQQNDKCNPNSIASTIINRPFRDNSGSIWFGSFGDGAIQYIPQKKMFEHYMARPGSPDFLSGNSVWGFAEDENDNVYMPLYDNGLDIFNRKTKKFTHLGPSTNKLLTNVLCGITKGKGKDMWLSTTGGGILRFNTETKTFKQYNNTIDKNSLIKINAARDIIVEPSGNLWIARISAGLEYFNPETETSVFYRNIPNNANSISNDNIWAILRDKKGNIWISCDGFVDMLNTTTKKIVHYKSKSTDSTGIISDKALAIFEDSKGNIWFGTSGGGLNMLDLKTNKFKYWTENEGMPNNLVYGILEDEEGCLWLSTNKGLSRFDVKANKFWNFYETDGLQSNEFNMNAFYKGRDNKMYFGGVNGFNCFYPKNIKQDTISPHSVITGLQVSNKPVSVIPPNKRNLVDKKDSSKIIRINDAIYLPYDITYSKGITLTYREKTFTIEFAGMCFTTPERVTYRYKMENFDADWNESGDRRFATYTNLPAGEYIFKVTASNASGIWNPNPTTLKIKILPPFWRTWWFFMFEGIFIFGLIMLVMRLRVSNLKHAKEELEKKVDERTHEIKDKNEELELRNLQIMKQKEEIAFQAQQLKTELTAQNQTSELALLRTQINPHFLFNTLNNIYSLVYQRSDDAPAAVMKLSEIMRYMLYEATSERVLLQNEINYLQSFIELQLLRLKNREFVSFNISGNLESRTISPMLLIAFVENAFKHGIKRGINPGIIINLDVLDNSIKFEVINYCPKNNTDNNSKDKTGGIGLTNIKRRLELLHPNKFKLEILNEEGTYHVKLQIDE